MEKQKNGSAGLSISVKSFVTAIAVIAALMIAAYAAAMMIPGGYIPFWKWLASPFLVVTAEGGLLIIEIVIFLLVIGGIFTALDSCGLMKYMLNKIAYKYNNRKYKLLAVVSFFFMAMGALIGSFEECVPMVPIVVGLAVKLGWDPITGLAMSLLSIGCGFASGLFNPFTVGVAQTLAGLPMFSGAWLRALAFVLIYPVLLLFITKHAKKVEKDTSTLNESFECDPHMEKGLKLFAIIMGTGIVLILSSSVITFLQDLTLVIVAVMFLAAGIASCLACSLRGKAFGSAFLHGVTGMLPAVLMVLMASSIKFTLEEAGVLDDIMYALIGIAGGLPKWGVILIIYLIVLIMNFFIGSGSAKAFMLMPLLLPLAEACGISAQLTIVAFAFGDGFSNVFFPTNAALLISLGLADTSYIDWAKWSGKFQLVNLILTSSLLLLGLVAGY